MTLFKKGFFASQGVLYKAIPIERYLDTQLMEFWHCDDMTAVERLYILEKINKGLKLPWWRRIYDYPGVIGQALGLRNIQIPFLNYCSERGEQIARILIPDVGYRNSPGSLRKKFVESPRMSILGYYIPSVNR